MRNLKITLTLLTFFFLFPQPDNATMNYWRAHLNQTLLNITSEYDALMYGGKAITQIGQKFQEPSPAASFISPAFSDMFFKSDICFRFNQSTCYLPNSTWYQATRNGLNSMMMRCLEELSLLIQDDNSVINYTNPRFQAWFFIGVTDLYDGIQVLAGRASAPDVLSPLPLPHLTLSHLHTSPTQTAAEIFVTYSIEKYKTVQMVQLVLMIVCIVLAALYLYFILHPYLALQKDEVVKVAGLVSHAPQEVDVNGHAKRIMRRVGNPKPEGNKVQPTAAPDAVAAVGDGQGDEDRSVAGGGGEGGGKQEEDEPIKGFGGLRTNVRM